MKTKYVFVIEDESYPPVDLERCYIFDNFEDAKVFYKEKGYYLELYSNDTRFSISGTVVQLGDPRWLGLPDAEVTWHGDVYKGLYY